MGWEDARRKRVLIRSMIILAVIAISAGVVTNLISQQVRAQDPLYQCIESDSQSYQAFVSIFVTVDGQEVTVPQDIGILPECLRPMHTHSSDGLVHIAYERPYEFKLGHFLWYWNFDVQKYDAKVYVNGLPVEEKSFDTVLEDGMSIRIDFESKGDSGII